MVFKRRDRRPVWQAAGELVYPRGGWTRAFNYVKLRLRRLPDTPEKVARGIAAGVFISWTPFFGLHMIAAALLAKLMRGNIVAGVLGTFFGNPLTFVPIGATALGLGRRILGEPQPQGRGTVHADTLLGGVGNDIWHNAISVFTAERMDWTGVAAFYDQLFLPYLVGGAGPGLVAAGVSYALTVPLVGAYQARRRNALRARLQQLGRRDGPDGPTPPREGET